MIRAQHALDPRVATSKITDNDGNHLATYDGITDTINMADGVTADQALNVIIRDFFADWIQHHQTNVALVKAQNGVK